MSDVEADVEPGEQRIARFKVSDEVAARIEKMILTGGSEPGDQLPSMSELSATFGVGRSSVREALKALEARNLVVVKHGIGPFVAETPPPPDLLVVDSWTVPDFFQARALIEGESAYIAAGRLTDASAAALREALEACTDESLSIEAYVEADWQLHVTIVEASGNEVLASLYRNLAPVFAQYSLRVLQLKGRRPRANEGHTEMVDALLDRDAKGAKKALLDHIAASERDIVGHLRSSDT